MLHPYSTDECKVRSIVQKIPETRLRRIGRVFVGAEKTKMRRVYTKKGLCVTFFSFAFVVGLYLLSPLLLSRAPILEVTARRKSSEQCGDSSAVGGDPTAQSNDAADQPINGASSVLCPNPGLVSTVISEDSDSWSAFSRALKSYKRFHAEKLEQMKAAAKTGSLAADVKTLTWACSQSKCTGLGDQLLRLQFFFILAMMSDRIFNVYWDEGLKKSSKYLLPNEIDWSYFDSSQGMCTDDKLVFSNHDCAKNTFDATSMWGFTWNKEEFSHFGEVLFSPEQHITVTGWVKVYTMYIGNDSILDPGEKIKAGFEKLGLTNLLRLDSQNTVHCGHRHFWYNLLRNLRVHHVMEIPESSSGRVLASEPWLQVSHVIFCYLFKFPQVLVSEVDKVVTSLGIGEGQRYLAVHLRTGFKGTPYEESAATRWLHRNWKMFDNVKVWDRIMAHSFQLASQKIGPNATVYLSTDTDVAKERFVKKYRGRLKVISSTATHSAFVRSNCNRQNTQTGDYFSPSDPYMSMWIDFFLLGKAFVILHGESSFSVAASFLYPVPHLNQVWYMQDNDKNCIASYVGNNSTCIT